MKKKNGRGRKKQRKTEARHVFLNENNNSKRQCDKKVFFCGSNSSF
jgi:hypothetical protein